MRSKSFLGLLITMLFTIIPFENLSAEALNAYNVTTNMGHYESNIESNIADGSKSTIFWSNSAQVAGQYLTVELTEDAPRIGKINLYFRSDDKPEGAKLQLSSTNTESDWTDLISFTKDDIVNNVISCDAQGATAKYVRLLLTESTSSWLKIAEIEINRYESLEPRNISAFTSSSDYGSVLINDEAISSIENSNLPVTLSATPNAGYKFVCWKVGEDVISYENTYIDETNGDKTYTAVFEEKSEFEKTAFRIKNINSSKFLTISAFNTSGITEGGMIVADSSYANYDQIFYFEEKPTATRDKYCIKSVSGYYVNAESWNAHAQNNIGNNTPYTIVLDEETNIAGFYQETSSAVGFLNVQPGLNEGKNVYVFCDDADDANRIPDDDNNKKAKWLLCPIEKFLPNVDKQYRLYSPISGLYMQIADYEKTDGEGAFQFKTKNKDSESQIFSFELGDDGKYYIKNTNAGNVYYVQVIDSNLYANSSKESATPFFFSGEEAYTLYQTVRTGYVGNSNENISDGTNIYSDQPERSAHIKWCFEEVYNVVYNLIEDNRLIKSIVHKVVKGSPFPTLPTCYGLTVNDVLPTEPVTTDTEIDLSVTSTLPFEFATTYTEIESYDAWYTLVMHGDQDYPAYLKNKDNRLFWKWTGDESTKNAVTNPGDEYYWAFIGNPIDGFKVVNKASGEGYILSTNSESTAITLKTEEGLENGYNIVWSITGREPKNDESMIDNGEWFCLKHPTINKYMNANAGAEEATGNVAFWSAADNGSSIIAMKPLKVTEAGIATYYSDVNIEIPNIEGVKAFYGASVDGDKLIMEEIQGTLNASNGIVVKSSIGAFTYAPKVVNVNATSTIENNLLTGTTKKRIVEKSSDYEYYILANGDNGIGMYSPVIDDIDNMFINDAYKSYLKLPIDVAQSNSFSFRFDDGFTTGVENVDIENAPEVIYTIGGTRVNSATLPGLYIVNGKKVYVK